MTEPQRPVYVIRRQGSQNDWGTCTNTDGQSTVLIFDSGEKAEAMLAHMAHMGWGDEWEPFLIHPDDVWTWVADCEARGIQAIMVNPDPADQDHQTHPLSRLREGKDILSNLN